MAFLSAAENVRVESSDGTGDPLFPGDLLPAAYADTITRYQFDLSGLKVAQLMRAQMEDYLRSQGALPAGVSLQMAQQYVDMTGVGEIWVSSRGLPVRQIMTLQFPAQAGAAEWVSAEVTTDFSAWGEAPATLLALNGDQPGLTLGAMFGQDVVGQLQKTGTTLGMMLVMLLFMGIALRYRHTMPVQRAIYAAIIVSISGDSAAPVHPDGGRPRPLGRTPITRQRSAARGQSRGATCLRPAASSPCPRSAFDCHQVNQSSIPDPQSPIPLFHLYHHRHQRLRRGRPDRQRGDLRAGHPHRPDRHRRGRHQRQDRGDPLHGERPALVSGPAQRRQQRRRSGRRRRVLWPLRM